MELKPCRKRKAIVSPYDPETAYLPLTKGKVAAIDSEDIARVSMWNWCFGNKYAQRTSSGHIIVPLHRVLAGATDGIFVDHIDGDKLNNRKSNLRLCSIAENSRNQKRRSTNTSGYKGVSFHRSSGKWHARITKHYRTIFLGEFGSAKEASAAYIIASREHHGDYGNVGDRA